MEVTKRGEDVEKDIHTEPQLFMSLIQQSEKQLIEQLHATVEQKIQWLNEQREMAGKFQNQLKGCEQFVEKSLKVGSQQQILRMKRSMIKAMKTVNQEVKPVVFQPIEEADNIFTRNQTLVDKCKHFVELKSNTFGKSILVTNFCYAGTITLSLQSCSGSPFSVPVSLVSCELSSANDSQPITCDVNEIQSGKYYMLDTLPKHQLIMQLGGVDILGSPFTLLPLLNSTNHGVQYVLKMGRL